MWETMKKLAGLLLCSVVVFLAACGQGETSSDAASDNETSDSSEKIYVLTTIAQIAEPLSVIGGERLEVDSLMGPSVDPHVYQATQSDIAKIENAELIFYNGLNLEANMVDIFNHLADTKPVVAIGEEISEESLLQDENKAVDPHIWFDIDLWKEALDRAVEELKNYSPDDADMFEENKQAYFSDLEALKEEATKLQHIPENHKYLVTAHDAFQYFGHMHNLEVIGLQGISTDDEIGVSDINETIDIIKKYEVPAIFVESSVNPNSINAVLEGAQSEGIDVTLGGELFSDAMGEPGTEEGTYIGMYRHNVDTIYEALMGGTE
ncbi:metal ABC transporter solute-binding protein, Zn/Mn family [Aliibacillus thermotolerans]|uniref:Metal ABC transporter solute-binding protein, Zn/Mn family n=1 Tax=Aliibacillus thermotolerans TaxID=1834418 RepID=A0ABW0UAT2_9BACI|nr:zinc ABC transporter substrate-binding protein [Aliibacillus thermotolerans]MDA3128777.1 manganese transporter [Aliibacillus thermotolerans]